MVKDEDWSLKNLNVLCLLIFSPHSNFMSWISFYETLTLNYPYYNTCYRVPPAQGLKTEKNRKKMKNKKKYGHPYLPWYINHFIPFAKPFPSKGGYKPDTLRWIMSNDGICLGLQPVSSDLCTPSLCWWPADKEREKRAPSKDAPQNSSKLWSVLKSSSKPL